MNHSLYQDGILKALPFKRLPWQQRQGHFSALGCVMTFVRYREDQWLAAKL